MLRKLLILCCMYCSGSVNAALITYNGYTLDTDTNIVSGNGLEWLQWDVTVGESITSAINANGSFNGTDYGSGWGVASAFDMASLFSAFGFNSTLDPAVSATTIMPRTNGTDNSSFDNFIELFGVTLFDDQTNGFAIYDPREASYAWYGAGENNSNLNNIAYVSSDWLSYNCLFRCNLSLRDYSAALQYSPNGPTFDFVGVALVRASAVPEPSTLGVLALGLLGIGIRRKLKV